MDIKTIAALLVLPSLFCAHKVSAQESSGAEPQKKIDYVFKLKDTPVQLSLIILWSTPGRLSMS